MKTEAELRRIQSEGAKASAELRRREVARAHEANMTWLGKKFKTRNSYSCPETEADYWTTYYVVTKVEGESMYAMRFDRDKYGAVRVETNVGFGPYHSPIECADSEFDDAWESILGQIVSTLERA